jgi:Leucine-rich repeat (LRR) protein
MCFICRKENIASNRTCVCNCPELNSLKYDYPEDLRTMLCYECPKLTSLEGLENCKNLENLECYETNIKSLEYLPVNNFKEISCFSCPITSLEPLEKCKNLEIINCSNCPISSIEPLSDLKLTFLDIGNCPIVSFECLFKFKNLTNIDLTGCNISSLEPLSNCKKLIELFCPGTDIMSLTGLENCKELKYLECQDCPRLTTLFGNFPKLERIWCFNSRLITRIELGNKVDIVNIQHSVGENNCPWLNYKNPNFRSNIRKLKILQRIFKRSLFSRNLIRTRIFKGIY